MRTTLTLLAAASLVANTAAQSRFVGLDPGTGELVSGRTDAASATLEVIGLPGPAIVALDWDASGHHLWAVSANGSVTSTGRLVPGTGAFEERSSTGTLPAFDDITAAPDGAAWYGVRTVGADVELWSGDLPHGHMTLVATFPATGRVDGLAIDRQGTLFAFEGTRGELLRLDPTTASTTVVGSIGVDGGSARGLDFDWATGELWTVLTNPTSAPRLARLDVGTGAATLVDSLPVSQDGLLLSIQRSTRRIDTRTLCGPATLNSSGRSGRLEVVGSPTIGRNDVVLEASNLARNTFGMFLVSPMGMAPTTPVGSIGTLCLGGAIGRIASDGGLLATGPDGSFMAPLDLGAIPTPTGSVVADGWGVWRFQAWFRDSTASGTTSNFTDAAEVTLSTPETGPTHGHTSFVTTGSRRIEVLDWDQDGFRDVVLHRSGGVQILPFERDGAAAQPIDFTSPTTAFRFYHRVTDTGDLTGDGIPDVIAIDTQAPGATTLWVGTNEGDGQLFTPSSDLIHTCAALADARIADVDGDGFNDVVCACTSSLRFGVWYGEAGGMSSTYEELSIGRRTTGLLVDDLDGNGLVDVVLLHGFTRNMSIFRQATPRVFTESSVTTLPGQPQAATLVDLDRDGARELVVVLDSTDQLSIFPGQAGGTFGAPTAVPTDAAPRGVTSADVNGDQWPDLLVTESSDAQLAVFYNDRTGHLDPPLRTPVSGKASGIATADLDHDGILEAFVSHWSTASTVAVELNPLALLPMPERFPVTQSFGLKLGDLNGDGHADAFTWGTGGASTSFGDGEGGFGAPMDHAGVYANTSTAHLVDVDADGDLDFVARQTLPTRALTWSLNDGAGLFAPLQVLPLGVVPRWLAVGDLNGDGLPEVVAAPNQGAGVEVAWNSGGTFAVTTALPVTGEYMSPAIGDLDGDGHADIMVAHEGTFPQPRLTLFYGTGGGSFEAPVELPSPVWLDTSSYQITLVDVDQDGLLDLFSGPTFDYVRNEGARTFTAGSTGPPLPYMGGFSTLDDAGLLELNGDGNIDGYVRVDSEVMVLMHGDGYGTFRIAGTLQLPNGTTYFNPNVATADLDGDGAPEVVTLGHGGTPQPFLTVWRHRAR